jgi:hypothetical protein
MWLFGGAIFKLHAKVFSVESTPVPPNLRTRCSTHNLSVLTDSHVSTAFLCKFRKPSVFFHLS